MKKMKKLKLKMASKVRNAKKAGLKKGIKREKRKLSAEEIQMRALKRRMKKYKKGSKEHNAALRQMEALKRKMARKIRAAKRAGVRKGIRKGVKQEDKLLVKEKAQMRALKARMSKYKKGSKEHNAALREMRALKRKMARKVKAAKKAGVKKGI